MCILTGSVPDVFVHLDYCDSTDSFCMLFVVCYFFSESTFLKNPFKNMTRVPNRLDPDQFRRFVRPDLGPNRLLKVISRQRGKAPFCTVSSKLKLTKQLNFLILFSVCRLSA